MQLSASEAVLRIMRHGQAGAGGLLQGLGPAALESVLKVLVRLYSQHAFESFWRRRFMPPPPPPPHGRAPPLAKLSWRAQLCSSVFVGVFEVSDVCGCCCRRCGARD